MSNATLAAPIVNLNGTSRKALLEGYITALETLRQAETALCEIRPHGRDYPGSSATWRAANAQHICHLDSIAWVIREITEIAEQTVR